MTRHKDMPMNQLAIPHQPGQSTDPDTAYIQAMGAEAYQRQQQLLAEERACTCGIGNAMPAKHHKAGCPAIPLRYGRR